MLTILYQPGRNAEDCERRVREISEGAICRNYAPVRIRKIPAVAVSVELVKPVAAVDASSGEVSGVAAASPSVARRDDGGTAQAGIANAGSTPATANKFAVGVKIVAKNGESNGVITGRDTEDPDKFVVNFGDVTTSCSLPFLNIRYDIAP